jgi:hypothetical protein
LSHSPWPHAQHTVFYCSNTGIVGSNPAQSMDVCITLCCPVHMQVLRRGGSSIQRDLRNYKTRFRNPKNWSPWTPLVSYHTRKKKPERRRSLLRNTNCSLIPSFLTSVFCFQISEISVLHFWARDCPYEKNFTEPYSLMCTVRVFCARISRTNLPNLSARYRITKNLKKKATSEGKRPLEKRKHM